MYASRLLVSCVLPLTLCSVHACTGTFASPTGPTSDLDSHTNNAHGEDAADGGAPGSSDPEGAGSSGSDGGSAALPVVADAGAPLPANDAGTGGGVTGLPCEVSDLLAQQCVSCHTQPPVGGAHVALLSLSDLTAQSPTAGAGDVAHDALARMKSTGSDHMPLGGASADSAQLAAFEAWVTSGELAGSCGSISDDAGVPPAPDPTFTGPTVCTSNQHWTSGNQGSSRMHPGVACINCHSRGEGPSFSLAGTLFPTGHEPDDCLGVNGQSQTVRVEVTDANGQVVSLTVNASGNFYSSKSVAFPITAKVIDNGSERVMATPVDSGDCNSCHTTAGSTGAPGRIALP